MSSVMAVVTAFTAADVARCESSARLDDAAVVLQVARNRAREWRRPLLRVLTQPNQFARGCPSSIRTWSWRHLWLGLRAASMDVGPTWSMRALFYCGPSDGQSCWSRRAGPVGRVVHTYFTSWSDG